jgi:hypothetical protein
MTARIPHRARRLLIDDAALAFRKPRAGPLVEPSEAIAIALSMLPAKSTGTLCSPDSPAVRHVLLSLKLAGYKVVAA